MKSILTKQSPPYRLFAAVAISGCIADVNPTAPEARLEQAAMAALRWEDPEELPTLAGALTAAFGVNSDGVVVGTSNHLGGQSRAVSWVNGGITDLGSLGGVSGVAWDVNDLGQITGQTSDAGGHTRAFIYETGTKGDLGTLGGQIASARAINELGQVVGTSQTAGGQLHATLFHGGTVTDLGTLGGAGWGWAINDDGVVAGSMTDGAGIERGFVWDGSLTFIDQGAARFTRPQGITPGRTVYGWQSFQNPTRSAAFKWRRVNSRTCCTGRVAFRPTFAA